MCPLVWHPGVRSRILIQSFTCSPFSSPFLLTNVVLSAFSHSWHQDSQRVEHLVNFKFTLWLIPLLFWEAFSKMKAKSFNWSLDWFHCLFTRMLTNTGAFCSGTFFAELWAEILEGNLEFVVNSVATCGCLRETGLLSVMAALSAVMKWLAGNAWR